MNRRFQFSLATVFVSVSLAAIGFGLLRIAASMALGGPFTNRWPAVLVAVCGWGIVGASVGNLWRDARLGALAAIYATPVVVLVATAVGVTFVLLW